MNFCFIDWVCCSIGWVDDFSDAFAGWEVPLELSDSSEFWSFSHDNLVNGIDVSLI